MNTTKASPELLTQLNRQIAETTHDLPLETETGRETKRLQNPDFQHGFASQVLKRSYNEAFNFSCTYRIPVPPVGPKFRFTLPDGTDYMTIQWGATHPEIQAEILAEWSVDCD